MDFGSGAQCLSHAVTFSTCYPESESLYTSSQARQPQSGWR
jgi:hypothetical protein